MRMQNKFSTVSIVLFACVFGTVCWLFFHSEASIAETNLDQVQNFNDDLNKASNYWAHNNLAFDYAKGGLYDKASEEYKKAIKVIENMPGDKWPNLKKEDVDRMNQQTQIDAQIFPR